MVAGLEGAVLVPRRPGFLAAARLLGPSRLLLLGLYEDVGVNVLVRVGKHREYDLQHPVPAARPRDYLPSSPIILSPTYQTHLETVTINE